MVGENRYQWKVSISSCIFLTQVYALELILKSLKRLGNKIVSEFNVLSCFVGQVGGDQVNVSHAPQHPCRACGSCPACRGLQFLPTTCLISSCDLLVLQQEQESIYQGDACCLCSCTKHIPSEGDQVVHGKFRLLCFS